MATLVCFHAHPDDEAIATGGLMAKASEAGHRVILVCATRGEVGEPQPGVLKQGEQLSQRRWIELDQSAEILGAEQPRWLGFEDSGMAGESTNRNPKCFWQADHGEATKRLAAILDEVNADVVTIYDPNGGYGHPDHIRVHTVGKAAAAAVGVTNVFEATFNREQKLALIDAEQSQARSDGEEAPSSAIDFSTSGTPNSDITYKVDVTSVLAAKRAAIVAHRSQIGPDNVFLTMPADVFRSTAGTEWFNIPEHTSNNGPTEQHLLPGLTHGRSS
jgi:LmbE family N-acetylglucosaminyl deacetylase